jgi:hypothetical protein
MAMNESIEEMMRMYRSMAQQWLDLAQPFLAGNSEGMGLPDAEGAGDATAITRAMLQALGAASKSSLSYGLSVQSLIYKYQASLLALNLSNDNSQLKRAVLIDEVRGFLREIGETASREGRNFQHQLAIITEQLAQAEAKLKHHDSTPNL